MKVRAKRLNSITVFDICLLVFFALIGVVTLYPFYHVIIVSLSTTVSYAQHTPYILPYTFDLLGYQTIFKDPFFYHAVGVTLFVTVVETLVNMLLSVTGAYVLSRRTLFGRNFFLGMILFTMLFSGGLIPSYLVNKGLGYVNNIWVMIVPCAINSYYFMIMKNYFVSLPQSLLDAAKIDGANELSYAILEKVAQMGYQTPDRKSVV